ncbi:MULTISPECIES: MalY/PatB family protein [Aerococcus]|uniref:cysteine-S-conjugate beta-lyase n=1 Tax=Aerococcus sanguinicola TaxID=119206 RepID=A0A5N1GGP8_9LACT|nr:MULTISPECIES: aminotransferase class I/II-fold pyridoxal phosphate-dependent enzyme [Aerococcus]KAA9300137.1 aminotransferase class I/II-fold pyridoxal phosphate-dependent enzyme [Aerococcus sanguinicola]MDK6369479.1 aminotransferase class I/II-fold pyridoxal phosphate-dependent enzyme [Aerococcus sp. UMB9870]MDK6679966.1 aminotransferase class I/II-fold pyridoxal phosphate-dependent enzyme [Aerococcus sp. UMB8608]MDK6686152.1 aminotransferase class I/II-fold pyridoxal phosphate-dependent en
MAYDFDQIIDRRGTNALNTDGFRGYIFNADESMTFPFADEDFIRMWVADMEFATPDFVREAIKDRLDRQILGYTKVFSPDYYEAVVSWTERRNGWTFPREELVTAPGIIPALYELVSYICQSEEDKVLILTPSYAYFEKAVTANGNQLISSQLIHKDGKFSMDFDDLEEKFNQEDIKLCIFCNPHNPTGRIWTEEELQRFGQLIQAHKTWLISDEIHCDIRRPGLDYHPFAKLLPDYDRLVVTFAQSKAFNMAGLMFSNVVIRNQELRQIWKENHYNFENPLSLVGNQAAYEKGDQWLDEMNGYLADNFKFTKAFIDDYLPQAQFEIPAATYLAWVDVSAYLPEGLTDLPLYFANEAGVLLEGGDMFVNNSDGYIRLNLAMPRATLKEGLERIYQLLGQKGRSA